MTPLAVLKTATVAALGAILLWGSWRVPRTDTYRPADRPAVVTLAAGGIAGLGWSLALVAYGGDSAVADAAEALVVACLAVAYLGWGANMLRQQHAALASALDRVRGSERALQQADKLASLGSLSAGVAHEVNNPLQHLHVNTVMIHREVAKLAVDPEVPPAARDQLGRVSQAARANLEGLDTIRRVVLSMLDLARPPTRPVAPADLAPVAEKVLRLVAEKANLAGITLTPRLDPTGPVRAPPEEVGQILLNLLLNAIESHDGAGGSVILESGSEAEDAVVRVVDDGPGVPPDVAARLFQPFVTSKPSGTGLGLSISHRLARSFGGDLEHERRADGLTVFTLRVPRAGGAT